MSKLDKLTALFGALDDTEALQEHELWDLLGLVIEVLKEQQEMLDKKAEGPNGN